MFTARLDLVALQPAQPAHLVQEPTDLPLLVRLDNRRYLRARDLREGGREDQFYFCDRKAKQVAEAPRGPLTLRHPAPALEDTFHSMDVTNPVIQVVAANGRKPS